MLNRDNFLYVEWLITYGCNFRCSYCFFGPDNLRKNAYMFRRHGPRLAHTPLEDRLFKLARNVGLFDYADALRNYPVEEWKRLFSYMATFKRDIYLSLTGGEPLILEKPIVDIVNPRDYRTIRQWRPIDEKIPVASIQSHILIGHTLCGLIEQQLGVA